MRPHCPLRIDVLVELEGILARQMHHVRVLLVLDGHDEFLFEPVPEQFRWLRPFVLSLSCRVEAPVSPLFSGNTTPRTIGGEVRLLWWQEPGRYCTLGDAVRVNLYRGTDAR